MFDVFTSAIHTLKDHNIILHCDKREGYGFWQRYTVCPQSSLVLWCWMLLMLGSGAGEINEDHWAEDPYQSHSSGSTNTMFVSPSILTSPQQLQRLDFFLNEMMSCRGVPGLTLSVVIGDQVALTRTYGYADVEADRPVTDDTVFCVASLTKAFTSLLLAKLLDRNGMTWDTRVHSILGDDIKLYDNYTTYHVTVRDLLLHRTGIPRYDLLWFSGKMTREELARHVRCLLPTEEFRSKAIYNNILYMLAGHVAELLGGKSWQELITEEILKPLGMNHSTFFHNRGTSEKYFAKQYARFNGEEIILDHTKFYKGVESIAPAIALCSTSTDMTEWMRYLLSEGTYHQDTDLKYTDLIREIFQSQVYAADIYYSQLQRPRTPVSLTLDAYTLGWLSGYYRGYPLLSHYGSFPGYLSMISLLQIYKIGIFTSINGGNQDFPYTINTLIHTYILDLLLGQTPWIELGEFQDPKAEACYFPRDKYRDYSLVPTFNQSVPYWRDMNLYTGSYNSPIYTDAKIWMEQSHDKFQVNRQNNMRLRMQYGLLIFTLFPSQQKENEDVFIAETDHKDWLIPHLTVHFHIAYREDTAYIKSLILPDFEIESEGHIFQRIEENIYSTVDNCDDNLLQTVTPTLITNISVKLQYFWLLLFSSISMTFL